MCDSDIVIGYDSMFVGCFRGYLTTTMWLAFTVVVGCWNI
jgi:hypothetical protein